MELCRDNGAYLFSDEMYRLLEMDPVTRLPSGVDSYEKAITLAGACPAGIVEPKFPREGPPHASYTQLCSN